MRIALMVPAPFDTISGGYEYDRRIVAAWRHAGHHVIVHELVGRFPLADDAAVSSARAAWSALAADDAVVIDGLAMPAFMGMDDAFAGRGVVMLNHHPTGLETGIAADIAASLNVAEQHMMPLCRHIVTTSQTTAATLTAQFGVSPERITVIEPGTDAAPRSEGSGTSTINVLSIGSLIPRKGHDVLLQAMARLMDLNWHLTIAGSPRHDPDTARQLQALPATLGIADRVTFKGELTGKPLVDTWKSADLFALATHYEGYGMVIAEALKRGLPVAICGGGAAGALVSPQTGVVCPPGDVAQLSKALRRLIFDTALRRDLANAAWISGASLPDWTHQAAAFAAVLATD